jgi:alpha-D-xyloside xylohydrolase
MMKLFNWLLCTIGLMLGICLSAVAGDYVKTADGIIVRPDAPFNGNAKEVRLIVVADNIIRVLAVADKDLQPGKSLMVIGNANPNAKWSVTNAKGFVNLKTVRLTAKVNLQTGAVTFLDPNGKKLLAERTGPFAPAAGI